MSEYQVFRENYDGKGKWLIVAAFMNQVGRVLNNIRGFGGVQAYVHQNGIDIRGGKGGTLDLSLFTFGLSATTQSESGETMVTINSGLVFVGGAIRIVPKTENLVVIGNPAFVMLAINKRSGDIPVWEVGSAIPAETPFMVYRPYYEFRVPSGGTSNVLSMIHHLGNVYV